MGLTLGLPVANGFERWLHPDIMPDPLSDPMNEPQDGFKKQRKERKMIATEEEMQSAKLPVYNRDYCAHLLIAYKTCYRDHFPFVSNCAHEKHEYLTCMYDDFVLRLKEYERERRMLERGLIPYAEEDEDESDLLAGLPPCDPNKPFIPPKTQDKANSTEDDIEELKKMLAAESGKT